MDRLLLQELHQRGSLREGVFLAVNRAGYGVFVVHGIKKPCWTRTGVLRRVPTPVLTGSGSKGRQMPLSLEKKGSPPACEGDI